MWNFTPVEKRTVKRIVREFVLHISIIDEISPTNKKRLWEEGSKHGMEYMIMLLAHMADDEAYYKIIKGKIDLIFKKANPQ